MWVGKVQDHPFAVFAERTGWHLLAELLRAADGVGLPARVPLAPIAVDVEDDDQDEDELAPEVATPGPFGGIDLNALVAQVVPMLITKAMNGGIDLSNLGALLDWRKAVPMICLA